MKSNDIKKHRVIIERKENIPSNFEGTVIDIETVGEFKNHYPDSRRYKDIQLVIFGFINRQGLEIFCAEGKEGIKQLTEISREILQSLEHPFYAFNTEFERGVLFHRLGVNVGFDGELQQGREPKKDVVKSWNIPNYDDPFFDTGFLCLKAWENGEFGEAIAHNRACLLKERDILIKRGYIRPNELKLVR